VGNLIPPVILEKKEHVSWERVYIHVMMTIEVSRNVCIPYEPGRRFGADEHHRSQFLKYLKTAFLCFKKS
jgi:hypothetical protein